MKLDIIKWASKPFFDEKCYVYYIFIKILQPIIYGNLLLVLIWNYQQMCCINVMDIVFLIDLAQKPN